MQDCVKLFVKICAETMGLKGQRYEFGSLQVSGQEGFADLRAYFPDAHYLGCDMRTGPGVDRIEDLEKGLSFENACATTVLCMGTLEHVFDVFKAMSEMKRIVKDEGVLIISLVFNCDIHAHPCDYWRFTPECFLRLLSGFDVSLIGALGKPDDPDSVFGVGVKTKNREKYLETLNMISKRYSLECETAFRYDKDLWRKAKLAAYKIFNRRKYLSKTLKTRTTWSILEVGERPPLHRAVSSCRARD